MLTLLMLEGNRAGHLQSCTDLRKFLATDQDLEEWLVDIVHELDLVIT